MLTTISNRANVSIMHPTPRILAALSVATLAATTLAACSSTDAAEGPDDAFSVVASTAIWGDVAESVVTDPEAEVEAIVEDSQIDPHSFEPAAADLARANESDVMVVGGGGYDSWLYSVVEDATIVHALPLIDHGHEGHEGHDHGEISTVDGNEHIWFDTDAVSAVAEDLAATAQEIDPTIEADAAAVTEQMDALAERIANLPALNVAQTETIGDYIIDDSPMTDVTPESYRSAALSHTDPAASDLAAFLELIDSGELDLLLYNPQTGTDMSERIRTAAEEAGVAVVEIGETPPEGTDFLDYFSQVVDSLENTTAVADIK